MVVVKIPKWPPSFSPENSIWAINNATVRKNDCQYSQTNNKNIGDTNM